MRLLFLFILLISSLTLKAQYRNEFGLSFGTSNYLGDIGGSSQQGRKYSPLDLQIQAQRFTTNGYYRYKLNKHISLKTTLSYIRLYGDDALTDNPERKARNLSFKTDIVELMTTGEWNIYQTKLIPDTCKSTNGNDFRLFIFSGIGFIYFNPKAELFGKTYDLRPLKTEGVSYQPFSWAIPIGMGLSYTINRKWRFGLDMSYRITGSDYLDDVSKNYSVSYLDGLTGYNKVKSGSTDINDIRMALGNRTSEVQSYSRNDINYNPSLPTGNNYDVTSSGGTQRGKDYNDGYFTINFSIGYVIRGKSDYYRGKNTYKRIRAKF